MRQGFAIRFLKIMESVVSSRKYVAFSARTAAFFLYSISRAWQMRAGLVYILSHFTEKRPSGMQKGAKFTKDKKLKKISKKVLTKRNDGDIISRLSRKATAKTANERASAQALVELAKRVRSLKIEQQREKYKAV